MSRQNKLERNIVASPVIKYQKTPPATIHTQNEAFKLQPPCAHLSHCFWKTDASPSVNLVLDCAEKSNWSSLHANSVIYFHQCTLSHHRAQSGIPALLSNTTKIRLRCPGCQSDGRETGSLGDVH